MEISRLLRTMLLLSVCQWANGQFNDDTEKRGISDTEDSHTIENTAVATTMKTFRNPRWYKRGDQEHDEDDHDDMDHDHDMDDDDQGEKKAISNGRLDYWGGYYDFLINEGSYKFWAVFQLATAALLIYSGFAALYYAKVNPSTNDDYDDYFLGKRRRRRRRRDAFLGLGPATFQRILDAVGDEFQRSPSG